MEEQGRGVSAYSIKLKDPRWQKKRLQILARDEWMCKKCFDSESTLVVHHRKYLPKIEPWEYPDELLVTLCETCHEVEGGTRSGNESDLIDMLKMLFWSEGVHDLANGFHQMALHHAPEVVASVYEWALSDTEIQKELIDRYFEYVKQKNRTMKTEAEHAIK